jgi:hypothetical protein
LLLPYSFPRGESLFVISPGALDLSIQLRLELCAQFLRNLAPQHLGQSGDSTLEIHGVPLLEGSHSINKTIDFG